MAPRAISGSPETLAGLLEQLTDRVGVEEVMIQDVIADHDDTPIPQTSWRRVSSLPIV